MRERRKSSGILTDHLSCCGTRKRNRHFRPPLSKKKTLSLCPYVTLTTLYFNAQVCWTICFLSMHNCFILCHLSFYFLSLVILSLFFTLPLLIFLSLYDSVTLLSVLHFYVLCSCYLSVCISFFLFFLSVCMSFFLFVCISFCFGETSFDLTDEASFLFYLDLLLSFCSVRLVG